MNEPFAPPAAPARAVPAPVGFYNDRRVFRRMVGRGALLEFVTVGFYRFWLANDMRRHLWSHTAVGGDTLEYTGTARELLIGFLFAVAILAPIYFIYFLPASKPNASRPSPASRWACSFICSPSSPSTARAATGSPARCGAACASG